MDLVCKKIQPDVAYGWWYTKTWVLELSHSQDDHGCHSIQFVWIDKPSEFKNSWIVEIVTCFEKRPLKFEENWGVEQ